MITPVKCPSTYAEWMNVLDMLSSKTDDTYVLEVMQKGTLEWQSGVAERFSKSLIGAINHRMNKAVDKFQRELNYSIGQDRVIIQALIALRKEMRFLLKVIDIPVIPSQDRHQYCQLIIEQADNMQKSLEDSAKKDRTGKLASILRNHRVNDL